MRLDDLPPDPGRRTFRLAALAVGGVLVGGLVLWGYAYSGLKDNFAACGQHPDYGGDRKRSALARMQATVQCLDIRNGPVENWLARDIRRMVNMLPNAPCSLVGVWRSERRSTEYRVTLTADGEFQARSAGGGHEVRGSWGVHGGNMVWFYEEKVVWPPDVNPLKADAVGFTLTEVDGTKTRYTLLDPLRNDACP
ncbi:MAG: hypothetical protein JNM82_05320 [Rhodocyclaceae bacterium]|nr:hypothetical protein [Rhodocyclaceae bacterium]